LNDIDILFLPGSVGAADFWHPLGALLPARWRKRYLSWPGLGVQPHDLSVQGIDDLVALAHREIRGPTAVIAQSMGGVVAIRLALRYPQLVSHLVLVATSGGVDVAAFGGADWRADYLDAFPHAARWIIDHRSDHGADLSRIACPALLLWGDRDPISPVAVGRHLLSRLPAATLQVIEGGEHDLGKARAAEIAPLVRAHLNEGTAPRGRRS